MLDALWQLGRAAFMARDPRVAHDAWTIVLEHRQSTLAGDDAQLQRARQNLALARKSLGDLRGAQTLEREVLAARLRTLADDHLDIQAARVNLAVTTEQLGDLQGALVLAQAAREACARTLADDHPGLQRARAILGGIKFALGDAHAALALETEVLEVFERTRPPDDGDLQKARINVAVTRLHCGDLAGAAALLERACDAYERTLPDDHPELQKARMNLAAVRLRLGNAAGARELFAGVCETLARTLPEEHPTLRAARLNLAGTMKRSGDASGARALEERVLDAAARTLPDDHPDLQNARLALGETLRMLDELDSARELQEKVLDVLSRTVPAAHPELQRARTELAITRSELGDLVGAEQLQETVWRIAIRTRPPDHIDVQQAHINLAVTRSRLGDLRAAITLHERAHDVLARTRPEDDPDLLACRTDLAVTKSRLGDLRGALALEESVHEILARTLPEDHPRLLSARMNLGETLCKLGDTSGALRLHRHVYETRARALPDGDRDTLRAGSNLAITMFLAGDADGARKLLEKLHAAEGDAAAADMFATVVRANLAIARKAAGDVDGARALQRDAYGAFAEHLPDHDPRVLMALHNLCWTAVDTGDGAAARRLARRLANAARRGLARLELAPRAAGAVAARDRQILHLLMSMVRGAGAVPAQDDFAGDALLFSQSLRGSETRTARQTRQARAANPEQARDLERELRAAVAALTRIAGAAGRGGANQQSLARRELALAVQRKEHVQRELRALAGGAVASDAVTVATLAARLPDRAAAVAIVGYERYRTDPSVGGETEERIDALVLHRDGQVELRPLARRETVERRVRELRASVADTGAAGAARTQRICGQLRRLVLDPILEHRGRDVDTLFLAVDEALELVPLDALPDRTGEAIGNAIELRPLVSLLDLLDAGPARRTEKPRLLAVGDVHYGGLTSSDDAAKPPAGNRRSAERTFDRLRGARLEVRAIARSFERAAGNAGGDALVLTGRDASKTALVREAPATTYLHIATHGYFAPESTISTTDQRRVASSGLVTGDWRGATGLSPLLLSGLALGGANQPPDRLGRSPGILTAEEILSLDLSHCELVTLSACDTSLGVRRGGQGYASLRAALQGAGARHVVTSLWKVADAATMALMRDFYRHLWIDGLTRHRALWRARMAARNRGVAFRDWAGWIMTGR